MPLGWTWKDATPRERGEWVRRSFWHCLGNLEKLCELFNLTSAGAKEILSGSDWKPEHEAK